MRVHWLQHAEHEELGCIGAWLAHRGHRVAGTRLHAGEPLPPADSFDWLIAMGGPMNVYQHEEYPWLAGEKAFIGDACFNNKLVLGICLGAQLISVALGGSVVKNHSPEIGIFEVNLTDKGLSNELFHGFPRSFEAFHWHEDMFLPPHGCGNLIKSDACVNQAFAWRRRVLALQFHPEVRHADARRWLAQEAPRPGRYVQNEEVILARSAPYVEQNALTVRLLERMEALAGPT